LKFILCGKISQTKITTKNEIYGSKNTNMNINQTLDELHHSKLQVRWDKRKVILRFDSERRMAVVAIYIA
jgi:hypothetical protein